MNPPIKRLLALAGSVVAGLFGVTMLASPAQAHHAVITGEAACQADGKYAVTWTVKNLNWDNPFMKITTVETVPATNGFTNIAVDKWLGANESVTEVQTVDGNLAKAKLTVFASWYKTKDGTAKVTPKEPAVGEVELPGKCAPVTAAGESTCNTFEVTITNSAEGDTVEAKVTYGTQTVPATLAKGESKKVSLTPSSHTEAVVSFANSNFAVKVPYAKPADCAGLPQTGSSTTTMVASGAGLAGLGVFVFFMARRRMVRLRRLAAE